MRTEGRLNELFEPQVEHTTYPFPLSNGLVAELRLPSNLRRKDAERIKKLLDTLVMNDDSAERNYGNRAIGHTVEHSSIREEVPRDD